MACRSIFHLHRFVWSGSLAPLVQLLSASIFTFALLVASPSWSETTRERIPTALRAILTLHSAPSRDDFTRHLVFRDASGNEKAIAMAFSRSGYLTYEGGFTPSGETLLSTLVDVDNRSYWDSMSFENRGGSMALEIESLEIEIEYDDTCCNRAPTALIGVVKDQVLGSGESSIFVDQETGRRQNALETFGWTTEEFLSLPAALREFIYDVGKSGTSTKNDLGSTTNPKYGSMESSLCSETVSWYYYTYGVRIEGEDFRDIGVHRKLHDAFLAADRLYCYHLGRQAWIRKDSDYNWVFEDEYHPLPGDYLDRRDRPGKNDGHAMMIVSWDENTQTAETIDGPWNINFLPVDVLSMESQVDPFDFCVGRIPFNDLD